jgi:iron complex outermembrane receptor protein
LISSFNLKAGLVEGDRDDAGFFIKNAAGGLQTRAVRSDFMKTSPSIPYQYIRHFKIATDNNFKIGDDRLSVNVGWQRNQREEFGNVEDKGERSLYFDMNTLTYSTQFHFKEKFGWKNTVGINGMVQQNKNKGVEQLIPNYRLNDAGIFGYLQKELNKTTFSGGLRLDNRYVDAKSLKEMTVVKVAAFTRNFFNISGSAGLTHQLNKSVNLKLNVARAFRAPAISELASHGAHEGTLRYEYGDVQLKNEVSNQLDGALEYSNPHFSVNLAGYHNSFKNYIFYRRLSSASGNDSTVTVDGEELSAFKFSQRKARLYGMEATLDIHPHPLDWLHLQNSFSMVSGKFAEAMEGVKHMPFIPGAKLLTELRADFKKVSGAFSNCYIKFEIDNNFNQPRAFTTYHTETATGAYTLLHAGVGADITRQNGAKLFSINLSGNNLSDIAYQSHLSRLKYAAENKATGRQGVFNMGRNFGIRINVPIVYQLN